MKDRGPDLGRNSDGEPVPVLGVRARTQRNAAILAVVLGLVALGGATLGFLMWQAKQAGRGDYSGASQMEPVPGQAPLPRPALPDSEPR